MTAAAADELRRAFARPQSEQWVALQRRRFLEGARRNGVPAETAETIFGKINGHYMFPESHSHAFAITAYQAAWLKRYHPCAFFVALVNQQPMGFYPLETLKEDARRFGVPFRNPCVNRESGPRRSPRTAACGWGCRGSRTWAKTAAERIVQEREQHGPYRQRRRLGAPHGGAAAGGALVGRGRGLRCDHPQPPAGALGSRERHPAKPQRAARPGGGDGRPRPGGLDGCLREDAGGVPGAGDLPARPPDGLRAARAAARCPARRRRGAGTRGARRCGWRAGPSPASTPAGRRGRSS